jgi:hypothetical protein
VLQGVKQAWTKIADAYNDPSWEPLNPTHHPFDLDDNGNPVPVYNCSLALGLNAWVLLIQTLQPAILPLLHFVSLYIKTSKRSWPLPVAAEKNTRSGWVPA